MKMFIALFLKLVISYHLTEKGDNYKIYFHCDTSSRMKANIEGGGEWVNIFPPSKSIYVKKAQSNKG